MIEQSQLEKRQLATENAVTLKRAIHRETPFVCLAAHETRVSAVETPVNVKLLPRPSRRDLLLSVRKPIGLPWFRSVVALANQLPDCLSTPWLWIRLTIDPIVNQQQELSINPHVQLLVLGAAPGSAPLWPVRHENFLL